MKHYVYYNEGVIDLKTNKIFIVFMAVFLVLIVGCSNGINNQGNKIVVEKRVGDANKYEHLNEISDIEEVQKVKGILDKIRWENAAASMAYPPHYKFQFEDTNKVQKSNGLIYDLWISPNKDKVELVIEGESKYVQLNNEKSAELFEIIIGKNLADG